MKLWANSSVMQESRPTLMRRDWPSEWRDVSRPRMPIPRNRGCGMARHKRDNKEQNFVIVPWRIIGSKAFIELSMSSGKCLPYFLYRFSRRKYDGQRGALAKEENVNEIEFSYMDAAKLGFSKGTFFRIVCELIEKGFLDPAQKGGLRGHCKTNSRFRRSERYEKYGRADFVTVDWRQFQ